jgi:tRNA A37 methylthiotransferase MiaB
MSADKTSEQNRILLVDAPFFRLYKSSYGCDFYPLALGYLAGAIKDNTNWQVATYNADFVAKPEGFSFLTLVKEFDSYLKTLNDLTLPIWKEIKEFIAAYRPKVLGISARTQNFPAACNIAKLAKAIDENILIIVGGPHPSLVQQKILDCPYIDICVIGEGEQTITELLTAVESGKSLNNVPGIIFRTKDALIRTETREFIKDLDKLSYPHAYVRETLKDYEQYPKDAFKYIMATRGCPYGCTFCGSRNIWGRKVRFRTPENVAAEIKMLSENGNNLIHFHDDTFGITRDYIHRLCSSIQKTCPDVLWSCEIHANLVDEKTVSTMKNAGCFLIQMGVESGNNEMLKKVGKNLTIERACSAAEIIKKHGITLHAFFMFGFPDETMETFNDTKAAMFKMDPDIIIYSLFTPYPGTPLFEDLKVAGIINDNFDMASYNHQSPNNYFCLRIPKEKFRQMAADVERIIYGFNNTSTLRRSMRQLIQYELPLVLHQFGPGSITIGQRFNIQQSGESALWAKTENATDATLLYINGKPLKDCIVQRGGKLVTGIVPLEVFQGHDKYPVRLPVYLMDTVTKIKSNKKTIQITKAQSLWEHITIATKEIGVKM